MADSPTYAYYWYKKNKNQVHEAVFPYLKHLDNSQSYKQSDNLRNMRLYGNMEFTGSQGFNYARTETSNSMQHRVTMNVVQSMIDTITSKITKNKPKPYFLTDGGDWTQQQKAKKLTQFTEGIFHGTDFYAKSAWAFKDACIFGTGCLKIFRSGENGEKIEVERVFIDEIVVDDTESYYGKPRQMHQKKWIHKDVLKAMFPNAKTDIDFGGSEEMPVPSSAEKMGDMLLVVESWHLPSGPKAKDGRHTICISARTLLDEEYNKDYFPFAFFRWNLKPIGFFGQGVAEQLTGLQLEINKLLRTIQVSMHLVSVPKMLVEASSKIVTAHLNNKIGGIIKYAGTKPEWAPLAGIPPELFTHLNTLYTRAYEIIGVSQLSASSAKPVGLNSGKAMRTFNDLETERFMETAQRYEKTFVDASAIMIDLAKEIAEETGNYKVKVPGSSFLKTIKWEDVSMEEDQYILQIFPTSALSTNPSSRLQEVQELTQAGFLSKDDAMKLLDFPDLKAFYNMSNAGLEDIEKQLERIIEDGEYQSPEPYQNLQIGLQKFQQAYLMFRSQGAPEERLELIRRWMEDANALMQTAEQSKMENEMAMNPQLAAPERPQTSDMVPNAPVPPQA
jgi:hypothetical protein